MQARELFDVVVKFGGGWCLLTAVGNAERLATLAFGLGSTPTLTGLGAYVLYFVSYAALGAGLIARSGWITGIIYRQPLPRDSARQNVRTYLGRADAAEATAHDVVDSLVRRQFLDVASEWRELARQAEQAPALPMAASDGPT